MGQTRRMSWLVVALAWVAILAMYAPLAAIAVLSLNANKHSQELKGFTTQWYQALADDGNRQIRESAWVTVQVALASTLVATALGTALAIGIERYPWPGWLRGLFDLTLYVPVVTPDLLFAAALVVAFKVLQALLPAFELGMASLILAHVTFQVAFVALVVRSRLAQLDPALFEAARDLHASGWQTLVKVTLPLIAPAVVAGALLALTLSVDDFIISFFVAGPTANPLPVYIYSSVRRGVPPEINALSTLVVLATVVLVFGMELLTRRPQRA